MNLSTVKPPSIQGMLPWCDSVIQLHPIKCLRGRPIPSPRRHLYLTLMCSAFQYLLKKFRFRENGCVALSFSSSKYSSRLHSRFLSGIISSIWSVFSIDYPTNPPNKSGGQKSSRWKRSSNLGEENHRDGNVPPIWRKKIIAMETFLRFGGRKSSRWKRPSNLEEENHRVFVVKYQAYQA